MAKAPRSRPLGIFGLNVRKRRESLDLTQIELSDAISPVLLPLISSMSDLDISGT